MRMRLGVVKELEWMGVKIDEERTKVRSGENRCSDSRYASWLYLQ